MWTMIGIPKAEEMRKESTYRSEADQILSKIAEDIKKQASNGFFSCTHQVSSSVVASCRGAVDLAMEDLRKLGYIVELEIDNCPPNEHYWDYIKIRWDKED